MLNPNNILKFAEKVFVTGAAVYAAFKLFKLATSVITGKTFDIAQERINQNGGNFEQGINSLEG